METDGYDCFLSAGLGANVTFEKDFIKRYNVPAFAFDGDEKTKDEVALALDGTGIDFIPQFITVQDTPNSMSWSKYFKEYNNMFVKMDIEGYDITSGEWPLLASWTHQDLNKIRQLVIELHFPSTALHWQLLEKLTQTHYMIHFHANNNNNTIYRIDKMHIPAVFECTYIRKDLLDNPKYNTVSLPTALDCPNIKGKMDYSFNCPPWVRN